MWYLYLLIIYSDKLIVSPIVFNDMSNIWEKPKNEILSSLQFFMLLLSAPKTKPQKFSPFTHYTSKLQASPIYLRLRKIVRNHRKYEGKQFQHENHIFIVHGRNKLWKKN